MREDSNGTSEYEKWFTSGRRYVFNQRLFGIRWFPFVLSLQIPWCSIAIDSVEPASTVAFIDSWIRTSSACVPVYQYHISVSDITIIRSCLLQFLPMIIPDVTVYMSYMPGSTVLEVLLCMQWRVYYRGLVVCGYVRSNWKIQKWIL